MNEFVVKNGLISQGNIAGTGSLVISNNITASNISASGTGSFNRVGIVTSNPGATLDVTGDARFTGNVGIGGLAGTDGSATVKLTLIGGGSSATALKFQSVNGMGLTSMGAKVFKGFVRAYVDSTVTDGVNPFVSGLYFIPMYQ